MKKILLFAAAMLVAVNLMAVDYPLTVAGTVVTDANEDDVFGDGTVSFDNDEHALTLSNATINGHIWYHPSGTGTELTIKVVGKCVIKLDGSESSGAIYSQVYTTNIVGFGTNPELEISNINNVYSGSAIKAFASGSRALNISDVKLKVISDSDHAIDCASLYVGAGAFIDALGADDKRGIKCDNADISYTGTKLVYCTKNAVGKSGGHHMIIVPESEVVEYADVLVEGEKINQYTANDVFQNEVGDTWDNAKKKLTLKGENYSYDGTMPFLLFYAPSTIEFAGPMKSISSNSSHAIATTAGLTITGSAETSISSSEDCAIQVNPAGATTLTFQNANVMLSASDYGIKNTIPENAVNLVFNGSRVEMPNVKDIANASFSNCAIVGDGSGPFALDNGEFVDQLMCDPDCMPITTVRIDANPYPLSVNANTIYPYNAPDIMGDGKLSYNHATKTLTVAEGADLDIGLTTPTVEIDGQDLTIVFEGIPGSVYSDDNEVVKMLNGAGHKLTFISKAGFKTGIIDIRSDNDDAEPIIDASGAEVEFRGANAFSLWGESTYLNAPAIVADKLIVNAPLHLSNANTGSIADILEVGAIELNENLELDPGLTELQFNPTTKQVERKSGSDKILEVAFVAKELDNMVQLSVAGINVTKANMADVLGDGKVSYDAANEKLILNNASINLKNGIAIYEITGMAKLTIELIGTNSISCDKAHGIQTMCDLEIVGSGANPYLAVDVEADNDVYSGIHVFAENVTIKDATVAVTSRHSAVSAMSMGMTEGNLTVDNANLRAALEESTSTEALKGCQVLNMLNGVALRYDEPAWPMVTWNGNHFDGADLSHIWIGKNADFPTDVENTFVPAEKAVKVIRDGRLYIIRGEQVYTITGARVK